MESIGKYKILGSIGQGGMGSIFKAQHPTLNVMVVVKKLTLASKDMVERFRREAKIQMQIVHPSIVQVYDHFEEKGAHYIVMEYVDGVTLEDLIKTKKVISNVAAMLIFSEISNALAYAHRAGVIHRDIKPANILISKEGALKFLDFGVASLINDEDDGLTKAGMTIGTISYIAPECIANAQLRDPRSDIYSAGVLLYEMVTGKKPFEGGFTPEMIQRVQKGKFTKPKKINPNLKGFLQRIILKMMHKKMKRRVGKLEKIIDKLSPYLRRFKDQAQINGAIKDYVEGKDDLESKATSPLGVLLRSGWLWSFLILMLGLGSAGAYLAFERGLKYEYIYPDQYGAFQLELRPKKGFKTADEVFYRVQVLRQQGKGWRKVENFAAKITHQPLLDQKQFWVLQSEKIYLEKGVYKVLLDLEEEQFQTTFFLTSLEGQKEFASSSSGRVLRFQGQTQTQSLPAQIKLQPLDLATGKPVTEGLETLIYHKGGWVDWAEFQTKEDAKDLIRSNKDYSFRVSGRHYYRQNINFRIQPQQTKITLKVPLLAKPVRLRVDTQLKNLRFLLDNKTSYLQAGKHPQVLPIPPVASSASLNLYPKDYYLTLVYDQGWGRSLTQTKEIHLKPAQGLRLSVDLADDGKSLHLTTQE